MGLAGALVNFFLQKVHFQTDSAMSGTPLIPQCLACQKGCASQNTWSKAPLGPWTYVECSAPRKSPRQYLNAGSAIDKVEKRFFK